MKPEQALEIATRLKGLLPRMTDDQYRFWLDRLLPFDAKSAARAVEAYAAEFEELSTPRLMQRVRAEAAGDRGDRRDLEKVEEAERQRRVQAIDAAIAALNVQQLHWMKREVLATLPDWTRERLVDRDPKQSAWLRALIFDFMTRETAGSAG